MDEMERFIGDGNIARFVDMLRAEADPARRETLKRLLIEEINRFGSLTERLAVTERHLRDGEAQISKLTGIVREMKGNGLDCTRTERTLEVSMMIRALFEELRSIIFDGIEKRRP
jgi:hypothetical protein